MRLLTEKQAEPFLGKRAIGIWLGRLAFVGLLLFLCINGGYIALLSFRDPDTCWLLGLGRWIVEHNCLPVADPFSYTWAGSGQPMVLYQWLFEVFFYSVYRAAGLTGILVCITVILTTAFVILPLHLLRKLKVPGGSALWVVMLIETAARFRYVARPEIFSDLFMAVWLYIIFQVDQSLFRRKRSLVWMLVLMPLLMVIWVNLHSGFVMGLVLQGLFVATSIYQVVRQRTDWWKLKLASGSLLLCSLASLINPWAMRLWLYLPTLFFCPTNEYIVELRPVNFWEALSGDYSLGFLVLLITGLVLLLARLFCPAKNKLSLLMIVLFLVGGGIGLCKSRLIPFSLLLMVPAAGLLVSGFFMRLRTTQDENNLFSIATNKLNQLLSRQIAWLPIACSMSLAGCLLIAKDLRPPQLPQSTYGFHTPSRAIQYIAAKAPLGRLLNDPQFGDVLIWCLASPPRLFLDTRFDMYGFALADEYEHMMNCRSDWKKLMDKYDIAWVFFPPNVPLVSQLKTEPHWKTVYADSTAVILCRQGK